MRLMRPVAGRAVASIIGGARATQALRVNRSLLSLTYTPCRLQLRESSHTVLSPETYIYPTLTTTPLQPNPIRRFQTPSQKLPSVRYCSYQRTMRKHHFGTDVTSSSIDVSKGREVLPKNVKPIHYDLTLEPNLETFEYEGKVVIEYV